MELDSTLGASSPSETAFSCWVTEFTMGQTCTTTPDKIDKIPQNQRNFCM